MREDIAKIKIYNGMPKAGFPSSGGGMVHEVKRLQAIIAENATEAMEKIRNMYTSYIDFEYIE